MESFPSLTTSLPKPQAPITVLHIDDDPDETVLLYSATRKAGIEFSLHNVQDGEQAIAYLSGEGIYADRNKYKIPALIFLDLKLPRATGFEVLKWIRAHPELGDLQVVVLSGSEQQDDMLRAYSTGADSYLVKPSEFDVLVSMMKNINALWLTASNGQRSERANVEQGQFMLTQGARMPTSA